MDKVGTGCAEKNKGRSCDPPLCSYAVIAIPPYPAGGIVVLVAMA
jgi:hypothetical protein